MSIYLLRHGQTDWNKQGIVQGRYDVPLNELGRQQAIEAGEKLKPIPFLKCYVSPLIRAKETALLALNGRDIPLIEDERLVEMAYGVYEGTNWRIEEYQRLRRLIANRYQGGESYFDVAHRAYSFLDEVSKEGKDANILIVCHGGIGRVIRSYYRHGCDNDEFIDSILPNGGIEVYEFEERPTIPPVVPLPK